MTDILYETNIDFTVCLKRPYGSWLFLINEKFQNVDKPYDRKIGDVLRNCVQIFYVTTPNIGVTTP